MFWLIAVLCPVEPVDVPINPVLEVRAELLEGVSLRANVPFSIRASRKIGMANIHVHWMHRKTLHFYTEKSLHERGLDDTVIARSHEIQRLLSNIRIDPDISRHLPDDRSPDWWMLTVPLVLLMRWSTQYIDIVG